MVLHPQELQWPNCYLHLKLNTAATGGWFVNRFDRQFTVKDRTRKGDKNPIYSIRSERRFSIIPATEEHSNKKVGQLETVLLRIGTTDPEVTCVLS